MARRRGAAADRPVVLLPFERILGGSDPRRALAPCPELECVRHRLAPGILAAAEQRALALGVGADRVLIAARALTEDAYVVALAAALRVAFEPLDQVPREACPLPDERLTDADTTGLLPLRIDGALVWVIAPRGLAARRLLALIGSHPRLAARIRLTSARHLRRFVIRNGAHALGHRAAEALRARCSPNFLPRSTPASSTCCCPASRGAGCRCRSAARRTISAALGSKCT